MQCQQVSAVVGAEDLTETDLTAVLGNGLECSAYLVQYVVLKMAGGFIMPR